jgi:hypothetical protein
MKSSGEEEGQRFLGFPTSFWSRWQLGKDWPQEDRTGRGRTFGSVRHPIAWVRWRIELRRRGPYAPDFNEFRRRPQAGGE